MKYVYIMRNGEYYKVGMAKNVQTRLAALQTSNPMKIELVASRLVYDAPALEINLHRFLADHKSGGGTEWFKLAPEVVIDVMIKLNAHENLLPDDLEVKNPDDQAMHESEIFFARMDRILDVAEVSELTTGDTRRKIGSTRRSSRSTYTDDELESMAIEEFKKAGRVSVSLLQRRFSIGYAKSARIVDSLEDKGIVGAGNGSDPTGRTLLV